MSDTMTYIAKFFNSMEQSLTILSTIEQNTIFLHWKTAMSCTIIPDVMIGLIPRSMRVLRLEARMTRIQYTGSNELENMIRYSETCG